MAANNKYGPLPGSPTAPLPISRFWDDARTDRGGGLSYPGPRCTEPGCPKVFPVHPGSELSPGDDPASGSSRGDRLCSEHAEEAALTARMAAIVSRAVALGATPEQAARIAGKVMPALRPGRKLLRPGDDDDDDYGQPPPAPPPPAPSAPEAAAAWVRARCMFADCYPFTARGVFYQAYFPWAARYTGRYIKPSAGPLYAALLHAGAVPGRQRKDGCTHGPACGVRRCHTDGFSRVALAPGVRPVVLRWPSGADAHVPRCR